MHNVIIVNVIICTDTGMSIVSYVCYEPLCYMQTLIMKVLRCLLLTTVCILVGGELPSDVLKLLNGKAVYPEVFMNAVSL
jgi:hypothetical protein